MSSRSDRQNPSGIFAKLRRVHLGIVEPIDRLAVLHQFELITRDYADEFGLQQHLLALIAGEEHALFFDFSLERLDPCLLLLAVRHFRQEGVRNGHAGAQKDQREDDLIEGMPNSPGRLRGARTAGGESAHLAAHLTPVDCIVTKFFFDS